MQIDENDPDGHTATHHPVGAQAIALSERLVRGATRMMPTARLLRDAGIALALRVSPLQKPPLSRSAGLG